MTGLEEDIESRSEPENRTSESANKPRMDYGRFRRQGADLILLV